MLLPDLSNVKWRTLASFAGIAGGTALGSLWGGIAGAAGTGIASLFMNVAATDAAVKWSRIRRAPEYAHSNHDLTQLVGNAIARVFYECSESATNKSDSYWFNAIGAVAKEKYSAICSHSSLHDVRSDRIPALFAAAAESDDKTTVPLLDEETRLRGEICTVAYALVDYLRDEAQQPTNDACHTIAENAIINGLFPTIREMFKRAFEGHERAYGALCLDLLGTCLSQLDALRSGQQDLRDILGNHATQLNEFRFEVFRRIDRIEENTSPLNDRLDELLLEVKQLSAARNSDQAAALEHTIEEEVQRRLQSHQVKYIENPDTQAKELARAAMDAILSSDSDESATASSGSESVLEHLMSVASAYADASKQYQHVELEARLKAADWAYVIGNIDVAASQLESILKQHPTEYRALFQFGRLLLLRKDYREAAKIFRSAMKAAVSVRDRAGASYGAGCAFLFSRQWKKGSEYLQQARTLAQDVNDKALELQATAYLAEALHRRKQRKMAVEALHDAIRIGSTLSDVEETAECFCHLGMVYTELGDLPEAETMHRKSLEWWRVKGNVPHVGQELVNVGRLCFKLSKMVPATEAFTDSLPYLEKVQNHPNLAYVHEQLAKIAAKNGDWHLALNHAKQSFASWSLAGEDKWAESIKAWYESIELYLSGASSSESRDGK